MNLGVWEGKYIGNKKEDGGRKTEVVVRCRLTDVRSLDCNLIRCQAEHLRVGSLEVEIRFGKKSALISDLFRDDLREIFQVL